MASSSTDSSAQYLKLEDLHTSSASSPTPSMYDCAAAAQSHSSPAPVVIHSRPAKKRKSWGQELPEPKTALPPRKRAKTDDEKEQRRIERIKRNRAAAHNSRERKRQETETLAVALAHANAKLAAYRKLHGELPADIVLPEVTLCTEDPDSPAPSLTTSRDTIDDSAPSPASPTLDTSFPDFDPIKQEPLDATSSDTHLTPTFLDNLDLKSSLPAFSLLDLTQHSAAMLCDLPCRSSSANRSRSSNTPTSSTTITNPMTSATAAWWSSLMLSLLALQFQTCCKALTLALWTISPSRVARMMQASAIRSSRSTSSSTTPPSSRSTPRCLALPSAATGLGAPRTTLRLSLGDAATARRRAVAGRAQARAEAGVLVLSSEQRGLERRRSATSNVEDEKKNGV